MTARVARGGAAGHSSVCSGVNNKVSSIKNVRGGHETSSGGEEGWRTGFL